VDQEEASRRIRQLLVSGDNILKNRDDDGRFARARQRFEDAGRLAEEHGLTSAVGAIITLRIEQLPVADE
jgi:hypothetical protein